MRKFDSIDKVLDFAIARETEAQSFYLHFLDMVVQFQRQVGQSTYVQAYSTSSFLHAGKNLKSSILAP